MIPMVLIRLTFIVLSNKVSQDLRFIRRMSRAVNDTGFWLAIRAIYISFLALDRALSRRGVSIRQDGFSSHIPAVTNTVGILPGRFLIRRFYYTFVNRFWDLHTVKHINRIFKQNGFVTKALNIDLFRPAIKRDVLNIIIQLSYINFIS